jgi:putative transposase
MTRPTIALTDLVEKGADADLLRQMVPRVVERVMEMDVDNLCGAGYGARSPDRQNSRNGSRERLFETRDASVDLSCA